MRVTAREAEVDRSDAMMDKLHIGRVGEYPDLSAALQWHARVARGVFKERDERGMRNRAVQRAASMEAVEAHAWAPTKCKVDARLHIGCVGREHEIKLDGDVGLQRMSHGHRAAQIVFFLGREN